MVQPQGMEVHMHTTSTSTTSTSTTTNQQQQQQQQPEPHSPIANNNMRTSAPTTPQSTDSNLRFPLSDNDLLGLDAPIMSTNRDDDTAPSSSDETPLYNVEGDVPEGDAIYDNEKLRPLIYGYLHKLGRNGKWQRRFFETDGECLSYYKSDKRSKQLAVLDLKKVGGISIKNEDDTGRTFLIQVSDRPYELRAENKQTCIDWVITLNRVHEARMNLGGVKLVTPRFSKSPQDFLKGTVRKDSGVVAPRVVLDANRPRTRAVDDEQTWLEMVETQVTTTNPNQQQQQQAYDTLTMPLHHNLAAWHKPRHTYYRFKHRVLKWARSIRKTVNSCTNPADQVILDSHLHPPGHDDMPSSNKEPETSGRQARSSNFVPVAENGEAREIS